MNSLASTACAVAIVTVLAGCSSSEGVGVVEDLPGSGSPTIEQTPSDGPSGGATFGPEVATATVQADVELVAPELETYFREKGYPSDLQGAQDALGPADITLSPGNTIGAYTYDSANMEFVLCIENQGGGWATYDTAPMAVGEVSETGSCPAG